MDALLIEGWLERRDVIRIVDEASLTETRLRIEALATAGHIPQSAVDKAKIVASELGSNQLCHARGGEMAVAFIERDHVPGLELVAADRGPGMTNVAAVLGRSRAQDLSAPSMGVGLAACRRMSDEMDFDIRRGEGSCITARIFAEPPAPQPEVAIVGRPHPSEQVSADAAQVVHLKDRVIVAVIDGVGHGMQARESALIAAEMVRRHAAAGLEAILESAHGELAGKRGAVMAVVSVDLRAGFVEHAGVGNVAVRLCGRERTRSFASGALTLGAAGRTLSVWTERQPLERGDVLVMFSDDLSSATTIDDPQLLREPPIAIAENLLAQRARGRDDAIVAVIR